MTDLNQVFLSYSRNDPQAAASLRAQMERFALSVFNDDDSIRASDQWLTRFQQAIAGCSAFVVLIGRDGVSRWIAAETEGALIRYFGPHADDKREPIFPILLGEGRRDSLPAFLQLFRATPWNGEERLPEPLLEQIRTHRLAAVCHPGDTDPVGGCVIERHLVVKAPAFALILCAIGLGLEARFGLPRRAARILEQPDFLI